MTGLAAAAAIALVPAQAQALGPAFTCDAITYQSIGNQLKIGTVDTSSSPAVLTYTDLGPAHTVGFNAGGYNTVDNFIYALTINPVTLLQIYADGSFITYPTPISGADPTHNFPAGDVSTDGSSLIVFDSTGMSVWSIDLITSVGTRIGTMPTGLSLGDIAIVTSGGTTTAYGFDNLTGALVSFDPTQNPITVNVNSSVAVGPPGAKGAVWTDASGNLSTFVNFTGEVYGVNDPSSASPLVGKVAKGPVPPSGNDGMKCALSASAFAAPTAGLPNTGVSSAGKIGLAATGLAFLGAGAAFILLRRNERERRIDQLNARLR